MLTAIISAAAAVIVAALTVYLTKQKERDVAWRNKKLDYYEEFILAANGIVGTASMEAKVCFALAINQLHLVASNGVIIALHAFTDIISEFAPSPSKDQHDELWSTLIWEIRADLGDRPTRKMSDFHARLWASGTGSNSI